MERGGKAFSLFQFRACLNSLVQHCACPSPKDSSVPIVSCTPHPGPRIKINTPCPSPPALPTRLTQAGGPGAAALLGLALVSCLRLLLICCSQPIALYVSAT